MKIFRNMILLCSAAAAAAVMCACRMTYDESLLQAMQSQGAKVVACTGKKHAPLPGKNYTFEFPQPGYAEYQPLCRKVMMDTLSQDEFLCCDGATSENGKILPQFKLICTFDAEPDPTIRLVPVTLSVKAVSMDGRTTYWDGRFVCARPTGEIRRMIFTSLTGLCIAASKNLGKDVNAPVNVLRTYHPLMKSAYRKQLDAAEEARAALKAAEEAETAAEADAAKIKASAGAADTAAVEAASAAQKEEDKVLKGK